MLVLAKVKKCLHTHRKTGAASGAGADGSLGPCLFLSSCFPSAACIISMLGLRSAPEVYAALTAPALVQTGSHPCSPDKGIAPCHPHCHLPGYSEARFFPRAQFPFKHLQIRAKFPEVLIRQLPPLGRFIGEFSDRRK